MLKGKDLITGGFIVLLFWWILSIIINNPAFPGPALALVDFVKMLAAGKLGYHFGVSCGRVLFSLSFSLLLAVPLGLATGRNRQLDRLLAPVVYMLYPIPKIVLLPLIMVLAGIGETAKNTVIILIIFFQILVTTRDASRSIPHSAFAAIRTLGAGWPAIYQHVVFPACLPSIISSVRISLGTAISVLFFAETVAGTSGLGYLILDGWHRANYGEMFAAILGMSILGLGLYFVLDCLERWWCRWQYL